MLFMTRILALVGLYVMLALGLNIVVGYAGLLDLGYIAFYAIGAYSGVIVGSAVVHALPGDGPVHVLLDDPGCGRVRRAHRTRARYAGPASARRLPRHRHAGLR